MSDEPLPDAKPAAQPAQVDILAIEPELSRIVRLPPEGGRISLLLEYLRQLTNAHGAVLFATGGPEVRVAGQSWAEPSGAEPMADRIGEFIAAKASSAAALVQLLDASRGLYLLASPVSEGGRPGWFVCLVLQVADERGLRPFVVILQAMGGFFQRALESGGGRSEWALRQASALVELGTETGTADDFSAAAHRLLNLLQKHARCARACLGLVRGSQVRLEAISGLGRIDKRGASTALLEAAMREVRAKGEAILCPSGGGSSPAALDEAAHRELLKLPETERIFSLPLFTPEKRCHAVLTFIWDAGHPYADDCREMLEIAAPYLEAQVLVLKKADPLPPVRMARHWWRNLGDSRRRVVAGAALGLLVLLCWPFQQHIRVPCKVQPVVKRAVAAPFDGLLKEARVEPGAVVERGTVLAQMDEKELRWRQAELQASRDRALKVRDRSMTDGESDFAQSQMAQLEAEQYAQDLRVVEYKIENLEIRSPLDGVVLAGDLKRAEGVPVSKGQVLFEVAPLERLVVELEIPDRDSPEVRAGMEVTVRLEALPGDSWETRVRKVNPQSEIRNGENVFVAEGDLPEGKDTRLLRPGMKGKAVIYGDRRPLFWLLTHRLWEFLRMWLFW